VEQVVASFQRKSSTAFFQGPETREVQLPELSVWSEELAYKLQDSLRVSAQNPPENSSIAAASRESGKAVLAGSVGDVLMVARVGLPHIKEKRALTLGRGQRRLFQQEDVAILQPLAML